MTAELLRRLHRQELEPGELLPVLRHLQDCAECARLSDELLPARIAIDDDPGSESEHLDAESQLFPWIDGTLDAADREIVETHLEDCAMCRGEADDLRRLRQPAQREPVRYWWAIAAAVVLALTALVFVRRDTPPVAPPVVTPPVVSVSAPPTYANPEWTRLIADVEKTHRLPVAKGLDALRPPADPLRGGAENVDASLSPAGIVVADVRPRFTWPAVDDATYIVSVFDGTTEVATSDVLRTASWTPPIDLPRERTLAWQVEVTRDGKRSIVPAPPAPPALFRIVSSAALAEIDSARKSHPQDHLLHAVLYARAGLVAEADAALRRAIAAGDPRASAF